jgi:hypothetical protein
MTNEYYDGIIEGLTRYAWWKDGSQYVGSCGTTLKEAINDVETERAKQDKCDLCNLMCDKDGIPNPKCHILPGNK